MTFFKTLFKLGAAAGVAELYFNPASRAKAGQAYFDLRNRVVSPEMEQKVADACDSVKSFVKRPR